MGTSSAYALFPNFYRHPHKKHKIHDTFAIAWTLKLFLVTLFFKSINLQSWILKISYSVLLPCTYTAGTHWTSKHKTDVPEIQFFFFLPSEIFSPLIVELLVSKFLHLTVLCCYQCLRTKASLQAHLLKKKITEAAYKLEPNVAWQWIWAVRSEHS